MLECFDLLDEILTVLSRTLAEEGLYPAIDVSNSVSRLMQKLATPEQIEQARQFRALWQRYADQEDLINIGAYAAGSDELTDRAIKLRPSLRAFLEQSEHESCSMADSLQGLAAAVAHPSPAREVEDRIS